ncbi:Gti1/Pac2 family-domain-containing protein [Mucor mucedo]|uniref:Gti1/Pac2 family-domain-containing protein n=1 Tax=Mucor mucedo TaxID=29922 RepID=UPI00221ECD35|nr:Gti1/Pac2 family-domain-containing protein [Mucor mucedo]KAI7892471.1 Gti1/Pac2 family-domain-containing protein [Mucor mucedo]
MPINATFHGFVETTTDSLLLFEACHRGVLPKISRRLQERERGSVKSGTVFIFDEKESGIKRWTDGLIWSPSRILGNFLIYRELGGRESLNEKAPNHDNYLHNGYSHNNPYMSQNHPLIYGESTQVESVDGEYEDMTIEERNKERNLVGSLTDTYKFRKGGLIKKTLSIQLNGCTQHLISYYTKEDVLKCRLSTPSSISQLSSLQISSDLLLKQSFRVPPSVEFAELMLKRPSLSPSSTTSSSTCHSTSTVTHNIKRLSTHMISHPYAIQKEQEEDDDHSLCKFISF